MIKTNSSNNHYFSYICSMKYKNGRHDTDAYALLKKYWGYDSFRPTQKEIIDSVLAHRDTIALLPTGGGKSLTYQIPALMMDGICIVVTPLIALMKDQVDRLRSLSIPATAIHSGYSQRQIDIALDNCVYGDIKFLFVSPERVATEMFRYRVERMRVALIAVDEAHCISQWGYDFRPTYLKIAELRKHTQEAPVLALTASATQEVVEDICARLKFKDEKIIRSSFARPNLVYAVRPTADKETQLMKVISSVEGSGIVYVRTRHGVEKLTEWLTSQGVKATFYHGGLPHVERSIRQDEWLTGKVRVMVATNAFGMGIDKPDVRFVVHYTMCDSLENYYQEAGRAGRDGKRSYALLLVAPDDDARLRKRHDAGFPPIEQIKDIYERVCSSLQIAIGDGEYSSHIFNLYDFSAAHKLFRGTVLSALKILEANNYMSLIDEMENPSRLMFCVSRDDLYKVRVDHDELDHFLRVLLRLYTGLFTEFRTISETEIAHWSGYTIQKVHDLLKRLWQMRLIRYVPSNRSPLVHLHCERLALSDLYISPESYKIRKDLGAQRFEGMLAYALNEQQCRSLLLEDYFGIKGGQECGVCDVCLEKKRNAKPQVQSVESQILELVEQGEKSIKELVAQVKAPSKSITECIEKLLDAGKLEMGEGYLLRLGKVAMKK